MPTPPALKLPISPVEIERRALIPGARRWSTAMGPLFAHPTLPVFPECNFVHVTRPPRRWEGEGPLKPLLDRHNIPHLRLLFTAPPAPGSLQESLEADAFEHRTLRVYGRSCGEPVSRGRFEAWPATDQMTQGDDILGEDLGDVLYKALLALRRGELSDHLGLNWLYASPEGGGQAMATGAFGVIEDQGTIQWVRVRERGRGKGLGTAIVQGCLEGLRAQGVRSVSALVDVANVAAIGLYQSLGFEAVGEMEIWERYR